MADDPADDPMPPSLAWALERYRATGKTPSRGEMLATGLLGRAGTKWLASQRLGERF